MTMKAEITKLDAELSCLYVSLRNDARYWDLRRMYGDYSREVRDHLRSVLSYQRQMRPAMITDIRADAVNTATLDELVATITTAEADLDDGLNAVGFDWKSTAKVLEDAKHALAARFGKAVGHDGVYDITNAWL